MWTKDVIDALPRGVPGIHMDVETWNNVGLPIAQDIVLCYMTLAVIYVCTGGMKDRWAVTHELWWYPYSFILVYYAWGGTWGLQTDVETRWRGTSDEAQKFMRLYVAAQVLAVPIELLCQGKMSTKLPMIGHHIVSIVGYWAALSTTSGHWFCSAAGLSEVSTIFLEGVLLSKRKEFASFFNAVPWFLPLNGALLWLTYIIFRLLLFPFVIAVYSRDKFVIKHPMTTYASSPETTVIVPGALIFLFILSILWFSKIHKGFMDKVVGRPKKKSSSSSPKTNGHPQRNGHKSKAT